MYDLVDEKFLPVKQPIFKKFNYFKANNSIKSSECFLTDFPILMWSEKNFKLTKL